MRSEFQSFYGQRWKRKSAGSDGLLRAWEIRIFDGSRGERFHRGDETDVRAANAALGRGHVHGRFGSGAAAIFLRAVETNTRAAGNPDLLGDGLVTGNLLLDRLDHAALTALCVSGCHNLLGDDVVAASFDLTGFGAEAGSGGRDAEH